MHDATQLAAIRARAIRALRMSKGPHTTDTGRAALRHIADGLADALSVLTDRPLSSIRAELVAAADLPALDVARDPIRA